MNIGFRSNVPRSRAYILALAARHPRNITNGAHIDPAIALSSYNKKQFHHVFPRAHLKRARSTLNDNLVINICMIAAAGNNAISDENPNTYLPDCAQRLAPDADDIFASNLLPKPSVFNYSQATYEAFLEARAQLVTEFVGELCGGAVLSELVASSPHKRSGMRGPPLGRARHHDTATCNPGFRCTPSRLRDYATKLGHSVDPVFGICRRNSRL